MKTVIDSNAMFFHGKTLDGYRFTMAGFNQGSRIVIGISLCSENDIFCKSLGRIISSGRAFNQRRTDNKGRITIKAPSSGEKLFQYFTEEAANHNRYTRKELLVKFGLSQKKKNDKASRIMRILSKIRHGDIGK